MPVQRTLFGQPVRFRMPPRRFQALVVVILFVGIQLTFYGPPAPESLPRYEDVAEAVKHPHLPDLAELPSVPNLPNPFGPAPHKPPVQPNSTSNGAWGAIDWLNDFKWRNPFSHDISFDENRAVLPPIRERPPIYTYYDAPAKQDKKISEAEHRLILAWRRAWWAQGFKPQVLSRIEAQLHPQYELVQRMKLGAKVEPEILRWLAWGHMRGGILANYLAFPVAEYENPMLSFLRRNEYPKLSRIQSLDNGVFFGEAAVVNDAIKKVMAHQLLKNVTANADKLAQLAKKQGGAIVNLLDPKDIAVDAKADGIAFYSSNTITAKYKTVDEKLTNTTQAEGLGLLAHLINSHLHLTFQQQHPEGVVIVKPLPEHTTALMYEAADIARNLTQCPASPMPESCPPNRPKCKPCNAKKGLKLQEFPEFVNSTKFFTIGTVPHPYTITSLHYTHDLFNVEFLRKKVEPNLWIKELTRKSIPKENSESFRVVQFKELVAATPAHSLWLTAERITQHDLDWIFGFDLPQIASITGGRSSPSNDSELIIFPRPGLPKPTKEQQIPDEKWIRKEEERVRRARDAIKSKDKNVKAVVNATEQWSPADTEAWKFARAYSARRRMERKKWEEDERKYSGSERKAGARPGDSGGGRWSDGR